MTLWANRSTDGKQVEVRVTYGPIEIKVAEDPSHARHFWTQLGKTLDEAEADKP